MQEFEPTRRLVEGARAASMRIKWTWFKFAEAIGIDKRVPGLVSILIPTLEERFELLASKCLPSVAAQSYQDFEVLIVSENYNESVASAVAQFDSRFRYLWGAPKAPELMKAGPLAIWSSGAAPSLNLALAPQEAAF